MKGKEHSEKTENRRSTEKASPEYKYAGFLIRRYRQEGSQGLYLSCSGGWGCSHPVPPCKV